MKSKDGVAKRHGLNLCARLAPLALFLVASWFASPAGAQTPAGADTPAGVQTAAGAPPPAVVQASAGAPTTEPAPAPSWIVSGDFRLRWERTSEQEPTSNPLILDPRHRWVTRFRGGVTRQFGKDLNFGVRIATGSRGDPNSTDITLGDFADRLEMSVDRAFLELKHGGAFLTGGKFGNPFNTTELVWDGDVNPQGVGASWTRPGSHQVTPKLIGLFYVVDENTVNPDSFMVGGQGQVTIKPSSTWSVVFAGAYYDYTIKSLTHTDAGDTRSNRLINNNTAYRSDFDLIDGIVTLDHKGFGAKYPIKFVGDYVKNLGADGKDDGFNLDLFVGRVSAKGDMRFRYGYSQAETDAVLAAFSHDNTTLATNYKQHSLTFDYQVRKDLQLNATWYTYRKLESAISDSNPWINRLRLNAMVIF